MTLLTMHPDRLFPADPAARELARSLHAAVEHAPVVSPHSHVDALMLAEDRPFANPAEMLVTPDHYVTRLLHSSGVPLDELAGDPRAAWRLLARHWSRFRGTPVRYWLEYQLRHVFGVRQQLDEASADAVYDRIDALLATSAYRPRTLFEQFGIDVLATTDDPADDLAAHRRLAADLTFPGRVLPTFRADRYMDPSASGWVAALDELAASAAVDCGTHAGLLEALRSRRAYFRAHGGTATDSGVPDAWALPLDARDAERIHAAGLAGSVDAADAAAYRRDLLYRLIEMSADDGMVMQLHPGVIRNHHRPTFLRHGPDTGHDLPGVAAFTEPLRRALNDFGTDPKLRLVLFTVDETAFSREIAPLAGFYPSVFIGAPWWFLDAPSAIDRFRHAVTETAGFEKTSGFIDDTRAFCSIPARHDMSRRTDAAYLASLVVAHRLSETDAADLAVDLVARIPYETFRIEPPAPPVREAAPGRAGAPHEEVLCAPSS